MFGFVKQIFVLAMILFGCNLSNVNPLKCVSMSNQKCIVRPEIVHVNSNESVFFLCSIKTSKCSSSCNNIHDLFVKLYVYDVIENISIKIFNLKSRINETR